MTFESGGYATWRCRVGHRLCCGCGAGSCAVTVVNGFWVDHDEFDGRLTRRLAHRLVVDAQVMPIRAVARRHLVSWAVIMTLVRAWSVLIATHRRSQRCKVVLVDETSMRKRHRYVQRQRRKAPEVTSIGWPTHSTSVQVLMRLGSVLVAQVRVPSAKRTRPMARSGPSWW